MRGKVNRPPPVCLDTTITNRNPHYRAETKFSLFQEVRELVRHSADARVLRTQATGRVWVIPLGQNGIGFLSFG